jgi:hypothetical protein
VAGDRRLTSLQQPVLMQREGRITAEADVLLGFRTGDDDVWHSLCGLR